MEGLYDIVYLLTKTVNDDEVLPKVKQHLSADGVSVVMQNGFGEIYLFLMAPIVSAPLIP